MSRTRKRLAGLATLALALFALASLAACGSKSGGWDPGASGAWAAERIAVDPKAPVQALLTTSPPEVGTSRLAIGLLAPDGTLIHDATKVTAKIYRLDGNNGTFTQEYTLTPASLTEDTAHSAVLTGSHLIGYTYRDNVAVPAAHGDPFATIYHAVATLDREGWWGAAVTVKHAGKTYSNLPVKFFVTASPQEPRIGSTAIPLKQQTLRDVKDIADIDSSPQPVPALHDKTLAEALATGKPVVVAFATPAFCQTRFCGPIMQQVVVPLSQQYQGRIEFLHIEPYSIPDARNGKLIPVPEMAQWGLQTEPWIFVIGADHKIIAKFEGITDINEVQPVLERLVGKTGT
jgi:hypothetical protein